MLNCSERLTGASMRLNKILVVGCLMLGFPAASFGETFNQDELFKTKTTPDASGAFARTVGGIDASAKAAKARKLLEVANSKIAQDPNNDRYYLARAQVFRDLQDFRSSLADIDHAISLNSSNQFYYSFRAAVWSNLNDCSAALKDIDKAISIGPAGADLYLNRAAVLQALGRYEESLVACNRSAAMDSKSSMTYVIRGITKVHLRDYPGAELDCKRAESMEPGNFELTKHLRELLTKVGN